MGVRVEKKARTREDKICLGTRQKRLATEYSSDWNAMVAAIKAIGGVSVVG